MTRLLVLVDSITKQAGVSTVAYSLAYTYSNWINRPALLVSIKSDDFYKDKCGIKETYKAKPVSIVNGNARNAGDLQVYCYKMNDLLYYYQAHSVVGSRAQMITDLQIFLNNASRSFGMVVVDMDSGTKEFANFLNIADSCFCVLPPDFTLAAQASKEIEEIYKTYEAKEGVPAFAKMNYVINKYEGNVSANTLGKKLGVSNTMLHKIPYNKSILVEANQKRLTEYLNKVLVNPSGIAEKTIEIALRRIYDRLRKG